MTTPVEESSWEDRGWEEGEGGEGDQEAELGQPSHLWNQAGMLVLNSNKETCLANIVYQVFPWNRILIGKDLKLKL